jgi:hypothetical protein
MTEGNENATESQCGEEIKLRFDFAEVISFRHFLLKNDDSWKLFAV